MEVLTNGILPERPFLLFGLGDRPKFVFQGGALRRAPGGEPVHEWARGAAAVPDTRIEVKKTQISFFVRHMFAAVSFTPVRKAKDRPEPFLTVTFGLPYRVTSQRIDASAEPYPGRWTHHVMIGSGKEINEELMGWIREAAAFSSRKR